MVVKASLKPHRISLRSIDSDSFMVHDTTWSGAPVPLESVEVERACYTLYLGANCFVLRKREVAQRTKFSCFPIIFCFFLGGIFLNSGKSYLITELNPDNRVALVRSTEVTWITQPLYVAWLQ
jgi:ATP-dependent helicase YprA (DUF1998 family)